MLDEGQVNLNLSLTLVDVKLVALYNKIEKPVNDNIRPNDPIPI